MVRIFDTKLGIGSKLGPLGIVFILVSIALVSTVLLGGSGDVRTSPYQTSGLSTSTILPTTTVEDEQTTSTTTTTTTTIPVTTTTIKSTLPRKYELSIPSCMSLVGSESADCFTELAVQEKDPLLCKNLGDIGLSDACIRHYGATTSDPRTCELFKDEVGKQIDCALAISAPGKEECFLLKDDPKDVPPYKKSFCQLNSVLRVYSNTEEKCEMIQEPGIKTYCEASASFNLKRCDDIDSNMWEGKYLREFCNKCVPYKSKNRCRIFFNNDGTLIKL